MGETFKVPPYRGFPRQHPGADRTGSSRASTRLTAPVADAPDDSGPLVAPDAAERSEERGSAAQTEHPQSSPERAGLPLWPFLLSIATLCAIVGFLLLPSGHTLEPGPGHRIEVYVDRPGVHMMAVLDAQDPTDMTFRLYADNPPKGCNWVVTIEKPEWAIRRTLKSADPHQAGGGEPVYTDMKKAPDLRAALLRRRRLCGPRRRLVHRYPSTAWPVPAR